MMVCRALGVRVWVRKAWKQEIRGKAGVQAGTYFLSASRQVCSGRGVGIHRFLAVFYLSILSFLALPPRGPSKISITLADE